GEVAPWIRLPLVPQCFVFGPLVHHFLLQQQNAVQQSFWTRRTSRYVHVDGDDRVDSLHHSVVVEHATARCTRAHRDRPLRLRHLLPDPPKHGRKLERNTACANQYVCLTRREALPLHTEAREVIPTRRRRHELDRTARGTE